MRFSLQKDLLGKTAPVDYIMFFGKAEKPPASNREEVLLGVFRGFLAPSQKVFGCLGNSDPLGGLMFV